MKNDESAFPQMSYEPAGERPGHYTTGGMSLRDYFAGQALMGICVCPNDNIPGDTVFIADFCYKMADAMLIAREKTV